MGKNERPRWSEKKNIVRWYYMVKLHCMYGRGTTQASTSKERVWMER